MTEALSICGHVASIIVLMLMITGALIDEE